MTRQNKICNLVHIAASGHKYPTTRTVERIRTPEWLSTFGMCPQCGPRVSTVWTHEAHRRYTQWNIPELDECCVLEFGTVWSGSHDITSQKTLIFTVTVITSNLTQHQLGPHVALGSQEIAHFRWKRRIHCCSNSHLPLVFSLWRIQSTPLKSISLGWI
jgi:hypothetical protein